MVSELSGWDVAGKMLGVGVGVAVGALLRDAWDKRLAAPSSQPGKTSEFPISTEPAPVARREHETEQLEQAQLQQDNAAMPSVLTVSEEVLGRLKTFSPVVIDGIDPTLHYMAPHIPREVWRSLGDLVAARERMIVPGGFVPGECWISLRLDGSNFSKAVRALRTRGVLLEKGFSPTFAECMVESLRGLMTKFNGRLGYTQSDEMCIFIPPTNVVRGERQPHPRNGRVSKLTTLASGYVSSRFIISLAQRVQDEAAVEALAEILPHFDCRLGVWKSWEEARALLLWRGYDCAINGVSDAVYQSPESTKAVCRLGNGPKVEWLAERGKLPLPPHQAHGTTLVRVKRVCVGHNPITNTDVETLRSVIEPLGPTSMLEHARTDSLFPPDESPANLA